MFIKRKENFLYYFHTNFGRKEVERFQEDTFCTPFNIKEDNEREYNERENEKKEQEYNNKIYIIMNNLDELIKEEKY